jgi:hypothetical protein
MKRYALKRHDKIEGTVEAVNIDEALDQFFPTTLVDVDLDNATPTRLEVRQLNPHRRGELFVIEELP